MKTKRWHLF